MRQLYLAKLYEPSASRRRIRYAIASILRDRLVNEGAFRLCFEMEDESTVVRAILQRGLRRPELRVALEHSHLVDLTHWLQRFPDIAAAWDAMNPEAVSRKSGEGREKKHSRTPRARDL